MEAELLAVETRLSRRPAQEVNDTTALTRDQQTQLDKHKVSVGTFQPRDDASIIAGGCRLSPSPFWSAGEVEDRE